MAVATCRSSSSYADDSTQVVSASTRCETHAPLRTNSSAARTCGSLSRVISRTNTFVSTACMLLFNPATYGLLHLLELARARRPLGKQRTMNVIGRKPAGFAHHDLVPFLVPLENRSCPEPQLPANFGGNRDLPLCGQLRVRESH